MDTNEIILSFVEDTLNNKYQSDKWIEIGILSELEINFIKLEFQIDLTDFKRIIDVSGIRHTLRKHGNQQKEELLGQIAVYPTDFALIPYIVKHFDKISKSINDRGLDVIIYEKKIIDTFFYVEEIRAGRKKVAINTMYKKKSSSRRS